MPGMTRCPTCEHPVLVLCDVTTDQAVTVDAVPFTLTGTWQVIDLLTGTATPTPPTAGNYRTHTCPDPTPGGAR